MERLVMNMVCKVCGRTIANEDANFCEYCGASFRPGSDNKIDETTINNTANDASGYTQYGQAGTENRQEGTANTQQGAFFGGFPPFGAMNSQNASNMQSGQQMVERPMTFGNWLVILLMPFVPVIGPMLFLVLLLMWSFNKSVPPTRKNWARAMLVFLLVSVLMLGFVMSSLGTTDMATLMNTLYQ